ncbi:MAG TPA: ImmA/IrrE family metallo-endopeptidase [Candidatus Limnocylindrales bacterium]|nr:ImmA/IrrE family metallo-endopeptidase [Candidatus Limnocylindrales bacterium]
MRIPSARIRSEVRRLLELPEAAERPVAVERIARAEGVAVIHQRLNDGEDISGFYLRDGTEAIIGVNAAHHPLRQRFTVAHELGHAVLDRSDGMHIDRAFKLRNSTSALAIDPDEVAANAFAAELLMPEDEVRQAVGEGLDITDDRVVKDLARRFGVSQQAFAYRLANLGLTLDGQADFG